MAKGLKPTKIFFDEASMQVQWADGMHNSYDFFELRLACPCAACVNELTGERMIDESMITPGVVPVSSSYVGNYALSIRWSDGHDTGIYTFKSLKHDIPSTPQDDL